MICTCPKVNEVPSAAGFPRNICNGCVSTLEDVSLFINISKNKYTSLGNESIPEKEIKLTGTVESDRKIKETSALCEDKFHQGFKICGICSLPSNHTSFEEERLVQLFQDITNIDVKSGTNFNCEIGICNICIGKLEDISSFVSSSLRNDGKIESAIGRNDSVKTENQSNDFETNSSPTCSESKVKNNPGKTGDTNQNCSEEIFEPDTKEECGPIDTEEEVFDSDVLDITTATYNNVSESPSRNLTKNRCIQKSVTFKCDCCEKSFRTKRTLKQHFLTHTEEYPFKCDQCEKMFNQKHSLRVHSRIHNKDKWFQCGVCDKIFSQTSHLKQHLATHTGEKPFVCSLCNKSFTQKCHLQSHSMTHTEEKPFKCDYCEISFSRKDNLRIHTRTHTGEKPFKCDCCENSFSTKLILQQHLRTHTGQKPFKCDFCDKRFARKGSVQIYLLSHAKERPFKCDFCEKSFITKRVLQYHLRAHTGEKPFECCQCRKKFAYKHSLTRHSLMHGGVNSFQ